MLRQFLQFIGRGIINYLGLVLCAAMGVITVTGTLWYMVIFAFLLTTINAIVKPFIIIFTLPIIAATLGFFLIVINGIIIYISSVLYGHVSIDNFWYAIVAGIVIGLLNYIVTIIYERLASS